nr:collagen alpha-2(I) chain-like isoform X1 [Saimiri boliviensis boliviensis]XP_039332136.1 collagen alpha-2(I) chain-like isoform X1 [Saimiri boliviensis boliviensis]
MEPPGLFRGPQSPGSRTRGVRGPRRDGPAHAASLRGCRMPASGWQRRLLPPPGCPALRQERSGAREGAGACGRALPPAAVAPGGGQWSLTAGPGPGEGRARTGARWEAPAMRSMCPTACPGKLELPCNRVLAVLAEGWGQGGSSGQDDPPGETVQNGTKGQTAAADTPRSRGYRSRFPEVKAWRQGQRCRGSRCGRRQDQGTLPRGHCGTGRAPQQVGTEGGPPKAGCMGIRLPRRSGPPQGRQHVSRRKVGTAPSRGHGEPLHGKVTGNRSVARSRGTPPWQGHGEPLRRKVTGNPSMARSRGTAPWQGNGTAPSQGHGEPLRRKVTGNRSVARSRGTPPWQGHGEPLHGKVTEPLRRKLRLLLPTTSPAVCLADSLLAVVAASGTPRFSLWARGPGLVSST